MAGGPRDYTAGTERALFRLARGTCYAPDCQEPIMRTVDGHPVVNVDVGHIHGANKGSARYDEGMTDPERASFANLILVCTAHHKLIDRLDPDSYPAETLQAWKKAAEVEGGLEALVALDGRLDGDSLADLMEEAVRRIGPTREVTVELRCGVIIPGYDIGTMTCARFREVLELNPEWARLERVLVTSIRNTGFTDVTVEAHGLRYTVSLPTGGSSDMVMLGQNLNRALNPKLPKRLLAGEATNWYTPYDALVWVSSRSEFPIPSVHATVSLGSGEEVASPAVPWDELQVPGPARPKP